jgi:hypothetical protein
MLEHDPEKRVPVFGPDHAQTINNSGMTIRCRGKVEVAARADTLHLHPKGENE